MRVALALEPTYRRSDTGEATTLMQIADGRLGLGRCEAFDGEGAETALSNEQVIRNRARLAWSGIEEDCATYERWLSATRTERAKPPSRPDAQGEGAP